MYWRHAYSYPSANTAKRVRPVFAYTDRNAREE